MLVEEEYALENLATCPPLATRSPKLWGLDRVNKKEVCSLGPSLPTDWLALKSKAKQKLANEAHNGKMFKLKGLEPSKLTWASSSCCGMRAMRVVSHFFVHLT